MQFCINPKTSNAKCNGRCEKVDKDEILNESDRNLGKIVCRRCASIIFPEDAVEYIENHPMDLRVMSHQGAGPLETERITWWWHTKDDMAFDTVGWQTIDKKKILMCGDCEMGPIGYRSDDNKRFWVAVERVSYKVESSESDKEPEKKKTAVKTTKEPAGRKRK